MSPLGTRAAIAALLRGAALLAIAVACTAPTQTAPDPLLVLEVPGSKAEAVDFVVVDLSGREVLRQTTGATDANSLPSLHAASAQVAFWRAADGGRELVVWNIATKTLKVIATSVTSPAVSPIWSVDGTEIVSLTTTTPIAWGPGATFEGKAEISVISAATGQHRTLATDRPFIPAFDDGKIVAGDSFYGEKTYIVVDARSGQALHQLALSGAVGVLPTASVDVVIAVRETSTPGMVTLHAMNPRTGAELRRLAEVYAQPMPSWPGRSEVVFVHGGELKAFDHDANVTRVVGPLEGATYALSFDPLGTVLLAARLADPPSYGTFTVADGRLTSAIRPIPLSSLGRPMGLVRVKV